MAKVLRHDQVGSERREQLGVYRVNAFAALHKFADLPINFRGRGVWVYTRPDERRFLRGRRRIVTFVRHADNGIPEAEGV